MMKLNANHLRSRAMRIRLAVCLAIFLCNGIYAFQLSMVASRAPFRQFDSAATRSKRSLSQSVQRSSPAGGLTGGLVSQLAVVALKLRLKDQTHVACDVQATSADLLLRGQVGRVTVKGRGWQSNLGLTCRAIEATVDSCLLDVGRIISHQKLLLTVPAEGNALIAMNSQDFGNFITHPLMRPPGLPDADVDDASSTLKFLQEGVSIDSNSGAVSFFGTYLDAKWKFTLQRGESGQKALVTATPLEVSDETGLDYNSIASGLTEATSNFFNDMVFNLGGTFVSFRDMMVTSKGNEPSVMLSLSILVRKFPSASLAF